VTGFWLALIAGTLFLLVFSWAASIREKRLHGYPRFFAFESVFVLVLLNVPAWFRHASSPVQILSWVFLAASIIIAAAGFLSLLKYGKPRNRNLEETMRLVTCGIFRFIRHPMYASLIYMGIGVFLKGMRPVTAIVLAVDLAACIITAAMEEREMVSKFGVEYTAYMKTTKRFIPFVF
jgi:protein-S-isoprenylcysteine O-methyltransferase Ste14